MLAGYLKLQIHTQDIEYLLLFNCNCGYTNMRHCYVYLRCLSYLSLVHQFADIVRSIVVAKKSEIVCFNVPTATFLLMYHIKFWLEDADVFSEIFVFRLEI
jgi:hypothetical protein